MRTRFGGIEETLRGGEGSIGCSDLRASPELIIAIKEQQRKCKNRKQRVVDEMQELTRESKAPNYSRCPADGVSE